jgi:hypothetical protein
LSAAKHSKRTVTITSYIRTPAAAHSETSQAQTSDVSQRTRLHHFRIQTFCVSTPSAELDTGSDTPEASPSLRSRPTLSNHFSRFDTASGHTYILASEGRTTLRRDAHITPGCRARCCAPHHRNNGDRLPLQLHASHQQHSELTMRIGIHDDHQGLPSKRLRRRWALQHIMSAGPSRNHLAGAEGMQWR